MTLKERIEKLLSEILSDKYEAKITLRFERKERENDNSDDDFIFSVGDCITNY